MDASNKDYSLLKKKRDEMLNKRKYVENNYLT